jgi:hypothetical protein
MIFFMVLDLVDETMSKDTATVVFGGVVENSRLLLRLVVVVAKKEATSRR